MTAIYIVLGILAFLVIGAFIGYIVELMRPEYPSDQAFIFHPGFYYVVYPDGERSGYMPKHIANNYAEIFNGKVHRGPKPEKKVE